MQFLKRFPEGKHEQIRQLMVMAQLAGLTGKDLVSIGGWLDRSKKTVEYRANKERINTFIEQGVIRTIGADHKDQIANRFKYKGANGDYNFTDFGWGHWNVVSMKTKAKQTFSSTQRDWPGHLHWNTRRFYDCVLDIADNPSWLNF